MSFNRFNDLLCNGRVSERTAESLFIAIICEKSRNLRIIAFSRFHSSNSEQFLSTFRFCLYSAFALSNVENYIMSQYLKRDDLLYRIRNLQEINIKGFFSNLLLKSKLLALAQSNNSLNFQWFDESTSTKPPFAWTGVNLQLGDLRFAYIQFP